LFTELATVEITMDIDLWFDNEEKMKEKRREDEKEILGDWIRIEERRVRVIEFDDLNFEFELSEVGVMRFVS